MPDQEPYAGSPSRGSPGAGLGDLGLRLGWFARCRRASGPRAQVQATALVYAIIAGVSVLAAAGARREQRRRFRRDHQQVARARVGWGGGGGEGSYRVVQTKGLGHSQRRSLPAFDPGHSSKAHAAAPIPRRQHQGIRLGVRRGPRCMICVSLAPAADHSCCRGWRAAHARASVDESFVLR